MSYRHHSFTNPNTDIQRRYPSVSSNNSSYGGYTRGSYRRPDSLSSGYGSGYTSPSPSYGSGYTSPILSPTFRYAQSPTPSNPGMKLYDVNSNRRDQMEHEHSVEYHQAPDTFPCGHVLCHRCLRNFMQTMGGIFGDQCPVCRMGVTDQDVSLAAMGMPHDRGQRQEEEEAPLSLLSNFNDIVKKFNGLQQNLRRIKDESVQSRSMGMTYTNIQCHMCREAHPTLKVIQEHNQLRVVHERPTLWSNYIYRLQQGKVVTTFYSKVNSSTICVPCTYRELRDSKAIMPAGLKALPNVDPRKHQKLALTEVGKVVAKSAAPLLALRGKNVIEVDHKIKMKERADRFDFSDTAQQIERMMRQQEEDLLKHATQQIKDTGQLYHVQQSHEVEHDRDETEV